MDPIGSRERRPAPKRDRKRTNYGEDHRAPTLDDALAALRGLAEENEARSEKTIVFCEDRLTLLSERAILSSIGGTFLTEVTTFARYLSGPGALSKQGFVMEISEIIAQSQGELVCFRPGAAQAVYETVAQLSASCVEPAMLRAAAEGTEGILHSKLAGLALILERYRERLASRGLLDENGYLALLPEKFSSGALAGDVVFFCFSFFTRQAREGVHAALLYAKRVLWRIPCGKRGVLHQRGGPPLPRNRRRDGCAEPGLPPCSLREDAPR